MRHLSFLMTGMLIKACIFGVALLVSPIPPLAAFLVPIVVLGEAYLIGKALSDEE